MIFICFHFFLIRFDSNLQRICFIELSNELVAPILDRFQKIFGFCVFSIRSFKFWVRRMVSFQYSTVYVGSGPSLLLRIVCGLLPAFGSNDRVNIMLLQGILMTFTESIVHIVGCGFLSPKYHTPPLDIHFKSLVFAIFNRLKQTCLNLREKCVHHFDIKLGYYAKLVHGPYTMVETPRSIHSF